MAGSWKVNTILGSTGFLFTYFFSFTNNTWLTSLFRAGLGFLLFFLLGYGLRIVLHQSAKKQDSEVKLPKEPVKEVNPPQKDKNDQTAEDVNGETKFEAISLQQLHSAKSSN